MGPTKTPVVHYRYKYDRDFSTKTACGRHYVAHSTDKLSEVTCKWCEKELKHRAEDKCSVDIEKRRNTGCKRQPRSDKLKK